VSGRQARRRDQLHWRPRNYFCSGWFRLVYGRHLVWTQTQKGCGLGWDLTEIQKGCALGCEMGCEMGWWLGCDLTQTQKGCEL